MTSEVPALPGLTDLSLLGRGGLADVYLARQQHLERWVAAKVFRVTLADEQAAERFRAECRAIGRLDQYPHVLTVYDAGVLGDGRPYLISERCDGSLHDLVGMRGPLPADRVAALGSTIGRALRFAHSAGVLHGDVTPQNLLLRTSGAPVLADFGLAVLRDHAPTAAGFTLLHAAPEALRSGAVIDERADVYGLGSTLYTVLTGTPPFPQLPGEDGAAYRARTREEPAPRPDGVTDQMAGLLTAMLATDPAYRPSTDEVITALETTPGRGTRPARSGGTLAATSPQPDPPSAEPVQVPVRAPRTRAQRPKRGASTPRPWDTRVSRAATATRTGSKRQVAVPATGGRAGDPAASPAAGPVASPAAGPGPARGADLVPGEARRAESAPQPRSADPREQSGAAGTATTGGTTASPGAAGATATAEPTAAAAAHPTTAEPVAAAEPTAAHPTGAHPTGAQPTLAHPIAAQPTGVHPTGAEPVAATGLTSAEPIAAAEPPAAAERAATGPAPRPRSAPSSELGGTVHAERPAEGPITAAGATDGPASAATNAAAGEPVRPSPAPSPGSGSAVDAASPPDGSSSRATPLDERPARPVRLDAGSSRATPPDESSARPTPTVAAAPWGVVGGHPDRWSPASTLAFTPDLDDDIGVPLDAVAAPVRIPGKRRRRRRRGGRALLAAGGATAVLVAGTGATAAWRAVDDGRPAPAPPRSPSVPPVAAPTPVAPRAEPADLPPAAVLPGSTLGILPPSTSAAPTPAPQRSAARTPERPAPVDDARRAGTAGRPAPPAPRRTANPAPVDAGPGGGARARPSDRGRSDRGPAAQAPPTQAPAAPAPAARNPAPPPPDRATAQGHRDPAPAPRPEIPYR